MGRRGRSWARAWALLGVLGVLLCGAPTPAYAHADLVASTPRAGDTVSAATDSLVLVFSEGVLATSAQVVVREPGGGDVVGGAVTADGTSLQVPLRLATAGRHEVSYRVTAADGHPLVGQYAFRVEPARGPAVPHRPGVAATDALALSGSSAATARAAVAAGGGGTPLWPVAGVGLIGVLVVTHRVAARRHGLRSGKGQHLGA